MNSGYYSKEAILDRTLEALSKNGVRQELAHRFELAKAARSLAKDHPWGGVVWTARAQYLLRETGNATAWATWVEENQDAFEWCRELCMRRVALKLTGEL